VHLLKMPTVVIKFTLPVYNLHFHHFRRCPRILIDELSNSYHLLSYIRISTPRLLPHETHIS
jgi:hypothetical protein